MNLLNIISFNANGLQIDNRRRKALMWGRQQKVDIYMIQETHTIEGDDSKWRSDWEGDVYMSHGTHNSRGVCILISSKVNYDLLTEYKDEDGRVVIIEISVNERKLTLCSSYAFNDDIPEFFASIIKRLDESEYESLIWGGDHNVVLNIDLDKDGGLPKTHEKCKNLINTWKDENEIDDIWRIQHPNMRRYTWRSHIKPIVRTRLDFFLTSVNISTRITKSDILPGFSSDHAAPQIVMDIKKPNSGKGFWKLNTELLKDVTYKEKIINCITETKLDNPGTEDVLLWDTIKCRVRGTSVKYSSIKKKERENKFKDLENLLIKAKEGLDIYPQAMFPHIHRCLHTKIQGINTDINDYIAAKTYGHFIRSRTAYYEEGEKNTKYFLSLEKKRGDSKSIKYLLKEDGTSISEPQQILEEEKRFYTKLYTSNRSHIIDFVELKQRFVENMAIPKLGVQDALYMTRDISEDELWKCISLSPDNKSPGTDGLSNEFYKCFWEHIKEDLLNSIKSSLKNGSLSISQRQGIISLIPKANKDLSYLKNWRPISLLNQDYKLIARFLAERCKAHLSGLVSNDQNGFVPGRYIGINIHRILNLIELCKINNVRGLLLNIDFEKAFDCIEWDFVYTALELFGFPSIFIDWVKVLYNNISACVINNGKYCAFFNLYRGVRQGCPLSPYLFVLAAEILSLYIKQKGNIEGIVIGKYNFLISQFADDTSLAIIGEPKNVYQCFKVLNEFESVSGLKVNVAKTEAMGLGGFDEPICKELNIQWVNSTTRVLGIQIAREANTLVAVNYENIIDKIKAKLNVWRRRNLSIIGKINIIKCLGISQIVFYLTMLPSPGITFLKELEKTLFEFIWNGGPDRIKRNTLIGPLDLGGVGMVDVFSLKQSINLSWIKRLLIEPGTWSYLITRNFTISLEENNLEYFLSSNVHKNDLDLWISLSKDNKWFEILSDWCDYNYREVNQVNTLGVILKQCIWYNSIIKVGNRPVFYKNWYLKGIKFIGDLIIDSKWKSHEEICKEFDIKINFLEYMGILMAIPKTWRHEIKMAVLNDQETMDFLYNVEKIRAMIKVNKEIYGELTQAKCSIPSNRWDSWLQEFNWDISEVDWLDSIPRIYRCTSSTRLRTLGYRFIIRDVLTNTRLLHMGKVESNLCYICSKSIESIKHLYWDCPNNKRLWERLKSYILEKTKLVIDLNPMELLLGIKADSQDQGPLDIINLLALATKSYIHSSKCKGKIPHEEGLILKFNYIRNIEWAIANKNGPFALRNHLRKWRWQRNELDE